MARYIAIMIGFCSSPRFVEHDTGPHHPERPDRIRAIQKAVRDAGLIGSVNPFPDFKLDLGLTPLGVPPLLEIETRPADVKWLRTVHPEQHIQHVRRICQFGGILDQGDTPCELRSFDTALLSAGAALQCCDAVMAGRVLRAFSAARPPGHHAEPDRAMGFCLFNNVAIAARYLQQAYSVDRVAIVDFDVHHGNGTQAVFETDPSVLFISMHQHPATCYPGSGNDWETGEGKGRGFTLNLPFEPGAQDMDYLQVIDSRVLPALDKFRPQVLLISAGFDAHRDDPLAQINLSEECFELMTRKLVAIADVHCGGRVVSVLEGGYHLRALGRSVVRHLAGLIPPHP
jgi:acetoin utilization deacetylase AcuC-like enzyme